jgi:hypothetical protein
MQHRLTLRLQQWKQEEKEKQAKANDKQRQEKQRPYQRAFSCREMIA